MKTSVVKFLIFLLVSFGGFQKATAQVFEKGTTLIDAGLIFYSGATPVTFGGEYGISKHIGVGASAYYYSKNIANSSVSAKATAFVPALKVNYHFTQLNELLKLNNAPLDFFAGLKLKKTFASLAINNASETASSTAQLAGQVGLRYLFTPKFGAYSAVDFGLANDKTGGRFELGLTMKL